MEAIEMERQMDSWNDERLDELSRRVDTGFAKVDGRFERLEGEMKEGIAKVATKEEIGGLATKEELGEVRVEVRGLKGEMGEVKGELRTLNQRFDRLLHALMVAGVGFGISMFAAVGGFIVSQA
jgi:hypothetical protein